MSFHSEADFPAKNPFAFLRRWFPKGGKAPALTAVVVAPQPRPARFWAHNADGTPYAVGLTVAELRAALERCTDTDEVCVQLLRKNGGGLTGKLKSVCPYGAAQIWLEATVLDADQE